MGLWSLWRRRALWAGRRSVVTLSVLLGAFAIVGILVRYSVLQQLDVRFTLELQENQLPVLTQLMLIFTALGSTPIVIPLTLFIALALWRRGHSRGGIYVLLSLLSIPANYLLKSIWERSRPDENLVHVLVNRVGFSFPSGHAMVSTAFYGSLAVLAWIHLREFRVRRPAVVVLALLPIGVDLSRVYLGAHWLSDVIGGTAASLILLVVSTVWYRKDKREVAAPIKVTKAEPVAH